VADQLGIRIVAPCKITANDLEPTFTALFPQFGASKGMIVDGDWDAVEPFADALAKAGYGFSCVTPGDGGNLDSLKEMFADWGWEDPGPAPKWLGTSS
jgi:hypothetical protein